MNGLRPCFDPSSFSKTKPREYATRFVFGGAISALAFYAAHHFGPKVGGLLLAFPALLPAALTLAKEHEARRAAAVHAYGAALGAVSLLAFAQIVRAFAARAALGLALALVGWFSCGALLWLLSVGLWRFVARGSRRTTVR